MHEESWSHMWSSQKFQKRKNKVHRHSFWQHSEPEWESADLHLHLTPASSLVWQGNGETKSPSKPALVLPSEIWDFTTKRDLGIPCFSLLHETLGYQPPDRASSAINRHVLSSILSCRVPFPHNHGLLESLPISECYSGIQQWISFCNLHNGTEMMTCKDPFGSSGDNGGLEPADGENVKAAGIGY